MLESVDIPMSKPEFVCHTFARNTNNLQPTILCTFIYIIESFFILCLFVYKFLDCPLLRQRRGKQITYLCKILSMKENAHQRTNLTLPFIDFTQKKIAKIFSCMEIFRKMGKYLFFYFIPQFKKVY